MQLNQAPAPVSLPPQLFGGTDTIKELHLGPRLMEATRLVCEGHANKEIAYRMNLTEGTVKVYLSEIYHRLGVGSRYNLIVAYHKHLFEMALENQTRQATFDFS
jgi:DNA-binding NarL/FixJ family response regulator